MRQRPLVSWPATWSKRARELLTRETDMTPAIRAVIFAGVALTVALMSLTSMVVLPAILIAVTGLSAIGMELRRKRK